MDNIEGWKQPEPETPTLSIHENRGKSDLKAETLQVNSPVIDYEPTLLKEPQITINEKRSTLDQILIADQENVAGSVKTQFLQGSFDQMTL